MWVELWICILSIEVSQHILPNNRKLTSEREFLGLLLPTALPLDTICTYYNILYLKAVLRPIFLVQLYFHKILQYWSSCKMCQPDTSWCWLSDWLSNVSILFAGYCIWLMIIIKVLTIYSKNIIPVKRADQQALLQFLSQLPKWFSVQFKCKYWIFSKKEF